MTDEPTTSEGVPDIAIPPYVNSVPTAEGMAALLQATRDHVEKTSRPETHMMEDPITGAAVPVIVTAAGLTSIPQSVFEPWRSEPIARTGTAVLTSLQSFIDHVNAYRIDSTALFACDDRTQPSITAVYDYNDPVTPPGGDFAEVADAEALPRFARHRAIHAFPLSDEWKAWLAQNGKAMSMADFAGFLEDRVIDVDNEATMDGLNDDMKRYASAGGNTVLASANKLMELSRGLKVFEESRFAQAENLNSGEAALTFTVEHRDEQGAKLVVPNMFILQIPVFLHGDSWRVAARLRYRKQGGSLVFWYDLWRIDRVFDTAFHEAIAEVKDKTSCPLYLGAPESRPAG